MSLLTLDTYEYQRWRHESLNVRCKHIHDNVGGCVAIKNVTGACRCLGSHQLWVSWDGGGLSLRLVMRVSRHIFRPERATPGPARASQPGKRALKRRSSDQQISRGLCVQLFYKQFDCRAVLGSSSIYQRHQDETRAINQGFTNNPGLKIGPMLNPEVIVGTKTQ